MAVTRSGRSIIMTAANDSFAFPVRCRQVRLVGTSMTAGQRLTITEGSGGAVIADHYVIGANEDQVIWESGGDCGSWIRKPFISAAPAAGTYTIEFQIE